MRRSEMDLDIGAGLKLDPSKIPDHLHPLIPYVERWAFERNEDQDDFLEAMERDRPEEVLEFRTIVHKNRQPIRDWLAGVTEMHKHLDDMTEADWAHPGWSFSCAVTVKELITLPEDDPEVIAELAEAKARFAAEIRLERYAEATTKANEAFRNRDYSAYISLLSPYEELLTPAQRKKMEYAARKLNRPTE
jgi:hypothetical protein